MNPRELKQVLVTEGFQVFRVLGSHVVLADRVRENLIMDSGVVAVCGERHAARYVVRAQAADHPNETEEQLFDRARRVGAAGLESGYAEVETAVVPVADPVESQRTLDTWYEVTFEKSGLDLAELVAELRRLLSFAKTA